VIPTFTETLFADTFDTDTSGAWTVNRSTATDTRVTFNYNYANDWIPSAPNSTGGTRRGVKFEANMANGAVAAICISPAGKSFTGDFDLKFDMWINANGPFPGGGTGSTEHLTAGVGAAGNKVQWGSAGSTADGTWFAVDGEGQAGDTTQAVVDFMAYIGTAQQQSTNTTVYAAGTASNARGNNHPYYAGTFPGGQTAPASQVSAYPNQTGSLAVGTVGMKWRDVLITKRGTQVEWFIDGLKIATIANGAFNGNNIFVGYWDGFASISDNTAMSFGLVDNVRVERLVEATLPAITSQPQDWTVVQGTNVTFTVSATGTTNLYYQWKLDGANISGATAASYTITNVQPMHEGVYTAVVTNIAGMAISSNAMLTVLVPPSILTQPESQNVRIGESVGFNVKVAGTEPLFYQWRRGGELLDGANASSLILTDVQSSDAGNYSVIVTNAAGSITSDSAELVIDLPPGPTFESIALNASGEIELVLHGAPGTVYLIQTSTNLVDWHDLTNVVVGDEETVEFTDSVTTAPHRFYRAVAP
jgi:hypothetical protein